MCASVIIRGITTEKKFAFQQLEVQLVEKEEQICKLKQIVADFQAQQATQQVTQQDRPGNELCH